MPAEIVISNIGDLVTAETATAEFLLLNADRRALPNHPALYYAGSINDARSNVIKVPHLGLMGYDTAGQYAEGAQVPDTALTDGSTTITVVRYSLARSASDLARIVRGNVINPVVMAADAVGVQANRMTQLICDAIDGFTTPSGTSGVDLDVADIVAALGAGEVANMVGPFMGALHGQQWSDLMVDAGTVLANGALQYQQATAELVALRGTAYRGSWLGVDWFVTNRVNSNGTDRLGGIWGPGGVIWADGTPPMDDPSNQMLIGGKILFERDREARAANTGWVSHAYIGAGLGIQNGTTLGSDA